MIGLAFSRLTVSEGAGRDRKRNLLWLCVCECGQEVVTAGYRLRSGETRSCGCLQRESVIHRNTSHGMTKSRLYNIWANMRARCLDSSNVNYGGRGISVCASWEDFSAFAEWASGAGYRDDLSIDRINNDGDYTPDNCRWATTLVQSRNKRPRRDQKLDDQQVVAIRASAVNRQTLATIYGVRPGHIDRIRNGSRRSFPTQGA